MAVELSKTEERELEALERCVMEAFHYMADETDVFSVSSGPWTISFDKNPDAAKEKPKTEEAEDFASKVEAILSKVDLSKVSPLPWKCVLENEPIADTGDVTGFCNVVSKDGEVIAGAAEESHQYKPVEEEDGDYDADMLAIADCVNAINAIKGLLKEGE